VLHEILASISANEPNFSTLQRAAKHVDEFAHRNLPRITQQSILADFDDPWVFQEKRPGAPTCGKVIPSVCGKYAGISRDCRQSISK
jgi:hypothetical protein